jgi:decaprenylphospho-beta-D-erythro-pentofuranosid-2-ulose 2-reductase
MPTVLILGATSDIAMAIADKFAAERYNVQLAARNVSQLGPLVSDLAIRHNVQCSLHLFDAQNFASHRSFYESLPVKPDVTVCVFGYLGENEKAMISEAETMNIIEINYTGAVSILNVVALDYASRKSGTIVGISSVAGLRGRQSNYMYGSAKAGFTTYLSGLRNRMFRKNVHVLTVLPGFVATRMTEDLNLPKLLTAQPAEVGAAVYKAVVSKANVIYVRWFWQFIMLIIRLVPEPIFKKLKL